VSDSTAGLRRQIGNATDLQAVVRTMRALAASSITQYERAVLALADYHEAVRLGLGACLRAAEPVAAHPVRGPLRAGVVGAIVLGSDQGLVGQFNDLIVDFTVETLAKLPGKPVVWAVGERVRARLADAGLTPVGVYAMPNSVEAIAPLVGRIQIDVETHPTQLGAPRVHVFHNRPKSAALYEPADHQLLPLDARWKRSLQQQPWPTANLPQVVGHGTTTLRALIREYLFISLFRAFAESLASENASRLAAMERADKNIDELLETLHGAFHRLRQSAIDAELFDVTAGYESQAQGGTLGG